MEFLSMIDNLVILKGRLTADAELKTTPNGKNVCSFTLAVDRGFGDNKVTDFLTCVAWEQRAEFISKYFNKGSEIRILGEINTRKWQDQNGNNRTAFEIKVIESGFCGSKSDNNSQVSAADPLPAFAQKVEQMNDFTEVGGMDDLPF
jgi:single-strand DNA-binding protein